MATTFDVLRYQYFAYIVIRDSLGFWFGIPKFLDTLDVNEVIEMKLAAKLKVKPEMTPKAIEKYCRLTAKAIETRVEYLKEDFRHCENVLFTDNVWLQLLDVDPEFFKKYLSKLPDSMVDQLAIVPNWTVRDDSLKRPYLNSDRTVRDIKF